MHSRLSRWIRIVLVLSLVLTSCRKKPPEETLVPTPQVGISSTRQSSSGGIGSPVSPTRPPGQGIQSGQSATGSAATAAATPASTSSAGTSAIDTFTVDPDVLDDLPGPLIPPKVPATYDEMVGQVERLLPPLHHLASGLDRTQTNLDVLGGSLDYSAETIIQFVRTQIAFEQYPGVLRGPFGTLVGRAGNAADQALLLQRLLVDAGYEARLVRGSLSPAQATTLVNQMAVADKAPPPFIDPTILGEGLAQLQTLAGGRPLGQSVNDPYATYREVTNSDTQLILDALDVAGIRLGDASAMSELVKEAQDYIWLQYRLSAFDPWIDAHPAFAAASAAPDTVAVTDIYRDGLPEELSHRLRLEIFVEQKVADDLIVAPVVSGWERSVADLVGRPITFRNMPNSLGPEAEGGLGEILEAADVFMPVIDGEVADRVFDLDGRVFGVALAAPDVIGVTSLAQAGAGVLEGAAGALGSLGGADGSPSDDLITLTAQWIEYTLIAPGGEEMSIRRMILDRIGPANRALGIAEITSGNDPLEDSKALLTESTILVIPTRYVPAYRSERVLERIFADANLLAYLKDHPDVASLPAYAFDGLVPGHDVVLEATLAYFDRIGDEFISYRDGPMLVVHQQSVRPGQPDGTILEQVDVVHNPRRVFRVSGGQVTPAPAEAVRQGVWETYSEQALIQNKPGTLFSTFSELRRAAEIGIPLRVLAPGDADLLAGLEYDDVTDESVRRDLGAGYVVIIPERPAQNNRQTAWWRIDPGNGETLGVASGGYGQAMVEYLISVTFAVVFGWLGYTQCKAGGGSTDCCFGFAVLTAGMGLVLGLAGGFILESLLGEAYIGLGFLVGDVGLGLGGFFGLESGC